ncbi:MAG: hypothetical protein CMF39_03275 [Legionellaceae bacterium]|nr:hypothetical protein [Legionellaceae bacterium]|tara:strand:+ start:185 stop:598 length:414 start_codon:yes stop_codon:yes gene_type:complete
MKPDTTDHAKVEDRLKLERLCQELPSPPAQPETRDSLEEFLTTLEALMKQIADYDASMDETRKLLDETKAQFAETQKRVDNLQAKLPQSVEKKSSRDEGHEARQLLAASTHFSHQPSSGTKHEEIEMSSLANSPKQG